MGVLVHTHDGEIVHPAGADLPPGASGWTRCLLLGGAYGTWLEPEDQPRARADLERVTAEARCLRTRADARDALEMMDAFTAPGRLRELRTRYVIARMRQLWPLRDASVEVAEKNRIHA